MILIIILILASIGLDQWTKYLAVEHLMGEASYPLWENVLHFTYVENRGAAFGMLADHRWVFMILSAAAIVILLFWLWKEKPKSIWMQCASAFIVGGGIGNMIDRIRLGYVVDFIDVRLIDFYVFNIADSFVCVGCAMFLLWAIFTELKQKKKDADTEEKAPETADEAGE
ncbi:MAG: signal peptidase II [Clostridia bacterium]|nr:signal peptidase II [Clostridia bacterium]